MAVADLTIYENFDGGDLFLQNDDLQIIDGLTNQVYLALFGGNVQQSESNELDEIEQRFDFWGGDFNSEFERKLKEVALNSAGIIEIENAAKLDLQYLQEFANIEVSADLTGVNTVELNVLVQEPDSQSTKLTFIWDGTKNTVIYDNTNI